MDEEDVKLGHFVHRSDYDDTRRQCMKCERNKERRETTVKEVGAFFAVADGGRRGVWLLLTEGTWADC